jgi:hypothetical protein
MRKKRRTSSVMNEAWRGMKYGEGSMQCLVGEAVVRNHNPAPN